VITVIYLSTLLRRSVYDVNNRRVGTLRDIVVTLEDVFPAVKAIMVKPLPFSPSGISHGNNGRGQELTIPWNQVMNLEETPIYLNVPSDQIAPYTLQEGDVLLARDILDKQIVDTQGVRVVKVNDLKLAQIKGTARLVGVDISLRGLLRRLGAEAPVEAIARLLPVKLPERTITWNHVEPLEAPAPPAPALSAATTSSAPSIAAMRLDVSHARLADLHPADIADIIEQLDITDARAILQQLDTETAADALHEVEPARQMELVDELDLERASDLLEMMPPDGAADILGDLPAEKVQRLLDLMPQEESQPIRDLLRYGESTAGGIMTSEVLALERDMTVQEALAYLRDQGRHLEMVYYLYVVDAERHLVGVVSLRRLVASDPQARLAEIMDTDVIRVSSDTDQEEVARLIAKYDLLGIPVVDQDDRLVGMVTVDDVIDVLEEEHAEDYSELSGAGAANLEELRFSWSAARSRLIWVGVNLCAGVLAALSLHALLPFFPGGNTRLFAAASSVLTFAPLLLFASSSISAQALGVASWYLRERRGMEDLRRLTLREFWLGTLGGVLATVVVGVVAGFLFRAPPVGIALGITTGMALFIAAAGGLLLPLLLQQLNVRGSWANLPLLEPAIILVCLEFFLGVGLTLSVHL